MPVLAFNMSPAVVQLTSETCEAAMYAVMQIATCLHVADECGPEGMLGQTGHVDASQAQPEAHDGSRPGAGYLQAGCQTKQNPGFPHRGSDAH